MSLRRVLLSLTAATLVAGLAPTLVPSAEAGAGLSVSAVGTGNSPEPVYEWSVDSDECLDGTSVSVDGVPDAEVDFTNLNEGTVTLPASTPAGTYNLTVSCTTDSGPEAGEQGFGFAKVLIDKVVIGEVPAGTEFVIHVVCALGGGGASPGLGAEGGGGPAIDDELTFGEDGGRQQLIGYNVQPCAIAEPVDGGAESTTVDTEDCGQGRPGSPGEGVAVIGQFTVFEPVECTQTVTNRFPPPDTLPDDVDPDVVPGAVVAGAPTFAG